MLQKIDFFQLIIEDKKEIQAILRLLESVSHQLGLGGDYEK